MKTLKDKIRSLGDVGKYDEQAKAFLEATKVEIISTYVGKKKHWPNDTQPRDVYEVIIKRGDKHFSITYGDSIVNTKNNVHHYTRRKPSAYSILCCLEKYEPESDIDSFASNLGIEKPSEAIRIYEAVKKNWKEVSEMFSADELEALSEIS